jgi:hypothetical protein
MNNDFIQPPVKMVGANEMADIERLVVGQCEGKRLRLRSL